jgi:hypothetical protein
LLGLGVVVGTFSAMGLEYQVREAVNKRMNKRTQLKLEMMITNVKFLV